MSFYVIIENQYTFLINNSMQQAQLLLSHCPTLDVHHICCSNIACKQPLEPADLFLKPQTNVLAFHQKPLFNNRLFDKYTRLGLKITPLMFSPILPKSNKLFLVQRPKTCNTYSQTISCLVQGWPFHSYSWLDCIHQKKTFLENWNSAKANSSRVTDNKQKRDSCQQIIST